MTGKSLPPVDPRPPHSDQRSRSISSPLVTCVCPTYKRPQLLQNALACFLAQEHERKQLIILDDAGQFGEQSGDDWVLHTTQSRFHTLPAKYNALAELVPPDTDIIAVWEDDDVYLPHHLTALVGIRTRNSSTSTSSWALG